MSYDPMAPPPRISPSGRGSGLNVILPTPRVGGGVYSPLAPPPAATAPEEAVHDHPAELDHPPTIIAPGTPRAPIGNWSAPGNPPHGPTPIAAPQRLDGTAAGRQAAVGEIFTSLHRLRGDQQ